MTGPPAARPGCQKAPPSKRANPGGIPVRSHAGALVAHIPQDLADRLIECAAAEAFRSGPRRYLRLRQGINVQRTVRGWDVIEFLRMWHGDKKAAGYVAHKDRLSERLPYRPPSPAAEGRRSPTKPEGRSAREMTNQRSRARATLEREG
jgi:hypothetical protein